MLRKCMLYLAAFLLFFTPAGAETAQEAAPTENPFIGAWQAAYYIQDGKLLTEEIATMIEFSPDFLTVHYSEDDVNQAACIYEGNTCSAWGGHTTFVLEGENLIVGSEEGLSFILTRIDPILLNNPFIGTWIPLCAVENGTVLDVSDWSQAAFAVFSANTVQLIDGDYEDVYPCTYADGACTLFEEDQVYMICTISEDGLLYMAAPHDSDAYQIICAREDEAIPGEITQFFGAWREIAALNNGVLATDQVPFALRPEGSSMLCQFNFSRASVLLSFPETEDLSPVYLQCTYADGGCTILYGGMPVYCTIDANGLMCLRAEDGSWSSWLVRVEEEAPAATE